MGAHPPSTFGASRSQLLTSMRPMLWQVGFQKTAGGEHGWKICPPPPKIDMAIMENHHFSWDIHLQTVGFSIVMLIFRGVSFFSFETDMVTMDSSRLVLKLGRICLCVFLVMFLCEFAGTLIGEILKIWGPTSELQWTQNCYRIRNAPKCCKGFQWTTIAIRLAHPPPPQKKNMLQN